MPIKGKFYSAKELQEILNVNRARISAIAKKQDWEGPEAGLYYAEQVEDYLLYRSIDPDKLKTIEYSPSNF